MSLEISVIVKWLRTVQGLPKQLWSPEEGEFNGSGETSKRRVRTRPGSPNHIDRARGEHPLLRLRASGAVSPKSELTLLP